MKQSRTPQVLISRNEINIQMLVERNMSYTLFAIFPGLFVYINSKSIKNKEAFKSHAYKVRLFNNIYNNMFCYFIRVYFCFNLYHKSDSTNLDIYTFDCS